MLSSNDGTWCLLGSAADVVRAKQSLYKSGWKHIVAADELGEAMILDGAKCDHERGVLFRKAKGIDAVPEEPHAAGVGAHEPELEAFQPDASWRCRHRG